jgi:type VI secretion system secreted protein Hcp
MAFDSFLKIDGVEGDSNDAKHKGQIDVLSFSWGETQSGSPGRGAGGGAGKVQMQDFHFTMRTSKASPQLMLKCANGEHIREATLTCRKAGGDQQDFLIVKLADVLVSEYSLAGSSGDDNPADAISLAFVKIDFVVKEQDEKGGFS